MFCYLAWAKPPALSDLLHAADRLTGQRVRLIVCLTGYRRPQWVLPPAPCERGQALYRALQRLNDTLQFSAANHLPEVLPDVDVWLLPEPAAARLHEHFADAGIEWQTEPVPQQPPQPLKPWQKQPENTEAPERVLVVGAGIAGAATAYELARRGVCVAVLEAAAAPAQAASGNRQGLLYAKISAHATAQTELLMAGYGHTRRLLDTLLPDRTSWQPCGVLHLNHSEGERRRNADLAAQHWHNHLYRAVDAAEAAEIAGIPMEQGGLFWPQGAWLSPVALIDALLAHPNIRVYTQQTVLSAQYDGHCWQLHTPQRCFSGSHVVFCTGADNPSVPVIGEFPFQVIRGQTSLATATDDSRRLRCALSAAAYISPAWQDAHCFGATFLPNDNGRDWRSADEQHNRAELAALNPFLYRALYGSPGGASTGRGGPSESGPAVSGSLKNRLAAEDSDFQAALRGHAAVRCDCYDHLPAVGALGRPDAMRSCYAKLALDKNYRLNQPCPYYPNAYANTAHGSRGLATAPVCAAQIAAEICGDTQPLSQALRVALSPNRMIIRDIVLNGRRNGAA